MTSNPQPTLFGNAATLDERLLLWHEAKVNMAEAVLLERQMREAIFGECFPNPKEGSQSLDLGKGYRLKADWNWNYSLANKEGETTKAVNELLASADGAVKFLAGRLIKWKPELSVGEWRDAQKVPIIKETIGPVLTIKPGLPSLSIEEPKAVKR